VSAKLERLLNLVAALLDTAVPLSAEQIQQRIESYPDSAASFRRAFERDKDDLREMGIPLRVEEIPGSDPPLTGYRISRREYSGQVPELTPDELAALHVASNLVRVGGLAPDDALRKLGGAVPGAVAPSEPMVALPSDPRLGPLFRAATELALVTFRYHGTDRTVEPYRLSFSRGQWYLSGFDRTRDAERLFRLDRIEGDVEVGEPKAFRRPEAIGSDPRVRAWELGDESIAARVRIDNDQALWAIHAAGPDSVVETLDDGSVVLELTVRNRAAFRSFVLAFLEHAEVLEPAELRADIVDWLEAMVGEPA
jgi:predicted DNA-binding transcriptional regulator YafY